MACLKWLKWLFIPVFAILLMSHNTYAIEPDANAVFIYGSPGTIQVNCNGSYQASMCTPNSASITSIQFKPQIAMPIDNGSYWVELYITFSSNGTNDAPLVVNTPKSVTDGTIATFESVSSTTRGSTTVRIYRLVYKYSGSNTYYGPYTISSNSAWVNSAGYLVTSVTLYKETTNSDASNQQILNAINNLNSTVASNTPPSADDIADAVNDAQTDATQDAADDSQTAGSSSSSDATNATTSLITAIGGFVSAISSASPTNCLLNANMNHIDMGQIDLCANPVPSYIQIIGSIILICAAIPLAIVLFNRFIGLFRSFQG